MYSRRRRPGPPAGVPRRADAVLPVSARPAWSARQPFDLLIRPYP